jgi:hypothetical protein
MTYPLLPWQDPKVKEHTQLLLFSYQYWLRKPLLELDKQNPAAIAKHLFFAPFVVVSHGTQKDPIFNYGNQKGLDLWEMTWEEFTQMPSRKTVAPVEEKERNQLLNQTHKRGYVDNYSGVRQTKTGKQFRFENIVLWDVVDATINYRGQAAIFYDYVYLRDPEQ